MSKHLQRDLDNLRQMVRLQRLSPTREWPLIFVREHDEPVERRLILRREPTAGLVVAERDLEYTVYKALEGRGVPVPRAHFLELDGRWLDRAFFIMDHIVSFCWL